MSDLYKISGKVVKTDDVTLTANAQGALETVRATNNEAIAGTDTNKALTPASGKALVDDVINTRLTNAVIYRGEWAITTSTNDYSGLDSFKPIKIGDYFRITGTGPVTIDGVEYNPQDSIVFKQNVAVGTTITNSMFDHNDHTDASDTVYLNATQTLTNKTLSASSNTISDLTTSNLASGVLKTSISGTPSDSAILSEKAVSDALNSIDIHVDDSTIEEYKAQVGDTYDTIRVKDGGITINKISSTALTTLAGETGTTIPTYAKVENMIENSVPNIDETTITLTNDSKLQASGLVNKRDGNAVYDWVGTLAQYEAAVQAGTITDDMLVFVTDDALVSTTYAGEIIQVSSTFAEAGNHVAFPERCQTKAFITAFADRVYIHPSEYTLDADEMGITFTNTIAAGTKVDVNFFKGIPESKIDDLLEAAETVNPDNYAMVELSNSPYTTNRILEIPQDIKLELNNGALTLKAGSKVYDGLGNSYTIPSDIVASSASGSNVQQFIIVKTDFSGMQFVGISDTLLSYNSITGMASYNGSDIGYLPIGISSHSGSTYTSIDQVFNGFGYIGSTAFALPMKGQATTAINADGTVTSTIWETTTVQTLTVSASGSVSMSSAGVLTFGFNEIGYTKLADVTYYSSRIQDVDFYDVAFITNSNMSNISSAGRSFISSMSKPSNNVLNNIVNSPITTVEQTYICPANGYIIVAGNSSVINTQLQVKRNGVMTLLGTNTANVFWNFGGSFSVSKGDTISLKTVNNNFIAETHFVYSNGEE